MATKADSERTEAARLAGEPYAFVLVLDDESGVWAVSVLEFPGVRSEGDSPDEAIANGREALEEMIDLYLEEGRSIPEPFQTREYSGTTQIRLNPESHRRAAMLAANEGVSLNRWFSAAVATYAGAESHRKPPFVAYGTEAPPGAVVSVHIDRRDSVESVGLNATVDSEGTWGPIPVDVGAAGARLVFELEGQPLVSMWAFPGGAPPDLARGIRFGEAQEQIA